MGVPEETSSRARPVAAAEHERGALRAVRRVISSVMWCTSYSAMEFYKAAFGAVEMYRFGGTDDLEEVVAQLAVGGASFWVEDESPPNGNHSPESLGGATVRMLLIVDDPVSVVARAVAAGATETHPVVDEHGWRLGRIKDPFGHHWEIGRPLAEWPPPGLMDGAG